MLRTAFSRSQGTDLRVEGPSWWMSLVYADYAHFLGRCPARDVIAYAERTAANIQGIIWQPDNVTVQPHGLWDRLGARQLLVQWTVVDGLAFVPGTEFKPV